MGEWEFDQRAGFFLVLRWMVEMEMEMDLVEDVWMDVLQALRWY